MQLGMVGLGRMGANIVRRIMRDGHTAVAFDTNKDTVAALEQEGAIGTTDLKDFVAKLEKPRVAWVMIPAGITGQVVEQLAELMEDGDIIIDGGISIRCSSRSLPASRRPNARPVGADRSRGRRRATCTAVRTVPGTSSRWST